MSTASHLATVPHLLFLPLVLLTFSTTAAHAFTILPQCSRIVQRLDLDNRATIRDTLQITEQRIRLSNDLQQQQPPANRTELGEAMKQATIATMAVQQDLMRLKAEHQLPDTVEQAEITPCVMGHLNRHLHPGTPVMSFMLQYFKRPWAITRHVDALVSSCHMANVTCEMIVNVDNPEEAAAWANASISSGGFVVPILSANVHEIRAYNRAARVARGRYLIIMQDDNIASPDGVWISNMQRIFDRHPDVGAIGMNSRRFCVQNQQNRYQLDYPYIDETLNLRYHFAEVVDFAPMALRRQAFEAVGGLDESLSEAGECGIWSDWELCVRLQMDGWKVVHMELSGFQGDGQEGGTHRLGTGERCWGKQQAAASSIFWARFGTGAVHDALCEAGRIANIKSAFKLQGPCPYSNGCVLPVAG